MIEKLSSYQELGVSKSSSLLDIVQLISEHLPTNFEQSKIDPIIFYLISIISEYRGWYITWEQNANPKDNENYIEIKNGKLDKLITGETYDYYKTFGILYSYLMDDTGEIPNIKKLEIK